MRRSWLHGWLTALTILASLTGAAKAADATPSAVITKFQGALIEAMKDAKSLGVKGRYDRLVTPIEDTFNMRLMSGISAASHWKEASDAQRASLTDAFRRMSVATLAAMATGYSGQTFEVLGEKAGPQGTVIVDTRLVDTDGSKISIAYVGRQFDGRWRFIDLIVDNEISELKTRESEYARTLKDSGINGLIALLDTKSNEILAK